MKILLNKVSTGFFYVKNKYYICLIKLNMHMHSIIVLFNVSIFDERTTSRIRFETCQTILNEKHADDWILDFDKYELMQEFNFEIIYDWKILSIKESEATEVSYKNVNRANKSVSTIQKFLSEQEDIRLIILRKTRKDFEFTDASVKLINTNLEIKFDDLFIEAEKLLNAKQFSKFDKNYNKILSCKYVDDCQTKTILSDDNDVKLTIYDKNIEIICDVKRYLAVEHDFNNSEQY